MLLKILKQHNEHHFSCVITTLCCSFCGRFVFQHFSNQECILFSLVYFDMQISKRSMPKSCISASIRISIYFNCHCQKN